MVREPDPKYFNNPFTIWVTAPHQIIEESLKELLAKHGYNITNEPAEADICLSDLCSFKSPYPDPPKDIPTLALIKGDGDDLAAILRVGYQGYIDFDTTLPNLYKALQVIADGGVWADRKIVKSYLDTPKTPTLTRRECEVQVLLLKGLSNASIAEKLGISVSTVKAHISSILTKSSARNRIELIINYKAVQE